MHACAKGCATTKYIETEWSTAEAKTYLYCDARICVSALSLQAMPSFVMALCPASAEAYRQAMHDLV